MANRQQIYVIDDDEPYRKSIVRLLKSVGYNATSFSSAELFLNSISIDKETGVLILDLRMPDIDGFELQQIMNEVKSRIQIIFITADSHDGDKECALGSGAKAFLLKPFEDQTLIETIQRALEEDMNREKTS